VCIIHGDNDYLYHDTIGREYIADAEVLAEVKKVAQQNPRAEVFIFRQIPRRHFLFFFPLHDGEFSYYRNGLLVAHELYWRDQDHPRFGHEVELYSRFHADNQRERVSMFLYFGHEIPEMEVAGYDASYPDRMFSVHDLADGLKGFTRDSGRFNLFVLATCYGGTPYTVGALGPFARTMIASPGNLHLSYFDLRLLEHLDHRLQDKDVPAFAARFARQAFHRLISGIQTEVSIAVYDVDRVQEFLHSVHKDYDHTLTLWKGETGSSMAANEHCDCADLPAYVMPTMHNGVEIFYRPARFGRSTNKQNHSGWECWMDKGRRDEPLQAPESGIK